MSTFNCNRQDLCYSHEPWCDQDRVRDAEEDFLKEVFKPWFGEEDPGSGRKKGGEQLALKLFSWCFSCCSCSRWAGAEQLWCKRQKDI